MRMRPSAPVRIRSSGVAACFGLVGRGQVPEAELKDLPQEFTAAELERWSIESDTPAGKLRHLKPTVQLSETPAHWARPSVPLGYNEPAWPARP